MAKNYHDVKRFLESTYPTLRGNISGGNYPVPPMSELFATLAGYLWIGGIALLLAGDMIFRLLGYQEPGWYEAMKSNKVGCFMGLFIINTIAAKLTTTGAFEIYLNDDHVIFSRLQSGGSQMPTAEGLINGLKDFGFEPV